jgi:hypothetical protein
MICLRAGRMVSPVATMSPRTGRLPTRMLGLKLYSLPVRSLRTVGQVL